MLGGERAAAADRGARRAAAGQAAYVPVLIEIDGPTLLAGTRGRRSRPRSTPTPWTAPGRCTTSSPRRWGSTSRRCADAGAGGLKFYGDLDLPPGDYTVRVLVRNGQTGPGRSSVASVPAGCGAQRAAAAPVLWPPSSPTPRALDRGAGGRASEEAAARSVRDRRRPFIPAARPVLPPGRGAGGARRLQPGGGAAQVRARYSTPTAGRSPAASSASPPGGAARPARSAAAGELRPAGLPPGEYLLRVTVTDPRSGRRSRARPPSWSQAAGDQPLHRGRALVRQARARQVGPRGPPLDLLGRRRRRRGSGGRAAGPGVRRRRPAARRSASTAPARRSACACWAPAPRRADRAFFAARLAEAMALRQAVLPPETTGYRLLNAEGDGVPGWTVDRFGDVLVEPGHGRRPGGRAGRGLRGARRRRSPAPPSCSPTTCRPAGPRGCRPEDEVIAGEPPAEALFTESGLAFTAELSGGQKTGFYCDQRENRRRVERLAGGRDRARPLRPHRRLRPLRPARRRRRGWSTSSPRPA